jgi:hypothetical protein
MRVPAPRNVVAAAVIAATAIVAGFGCPGTGGANFGRQGVGDSPGGITVGLGNIGVSPTGDFVVFQNDSSLSVARPDDGNVYPLPVSHPTRLEFGNESDVIWVGSDETHDVRAIDVITREVLWSVPVHDSDVASLRLAATSNDNRLVITSRTKVYVVDTATGEVLREHAAPANVIDLHVLPDDTRAILVSEHEWGPTSDAPSTPVTIVDLKTGDMRGFAVPNCSDRIAVSGDARYALLAPLTCQKDPVSVIDLEIGGESFVKNLPGFGPVSMSATGHQAVAWLDSTNVDESLFDDPSQIPPADTGANRYHLMVIDTNTTKFTLHPVGEHLPRYSVTPDGRVVLVDDVMDGAARIFDLEDGRFHAIDGPAIQLDHFAMTADSRHAYGLRVQGVDHVEDGMNTNNVMYHIDVAERVGEFMRAPFFPTHLNISADDRFLFLRRSARSVCVYSIETEACVQNLAPAGAEDEAEHDGVYRTTG